MQARVVDLHAPGRVAAVEQELMSSRLDEFGDGWVHVGGMPIQTDHL